MVRGVESWTGPTTGEPVLLIPAEGVSILWTRLLGPVGTRGTCICVPGVRETRGVGLTILAAALGIPGPTVARGEGRAGFSATWLATPTWGEIPTPICVCTPPMGLIPPLGLMSAFAVTGEARVTRASPDGRATVSPGLNERAAMETALAPTETTVGGRATVRPATDDVGIVVH